jgi:hypothetical protein
MSILGDLALAAIASVCIALPAAAQPLALTPTAQLPRDEFARPGAGIDGAPGGMLPGADPFMLLANSREVQRDLRLDEDQILHLRRTDQMFRTQLDELAHSPGASAQREAKREIWTDRGAIAKILMPEQLSRLNQIMLQIEGPCMVLHDKRMLDELGVEANQEQQLEGACSELGREIRRAFRPPAPGEDPCRGLEANRMRIGKIRARGRTRVLALLSSQQRRTLERMQGAKLVLEPMMPPECRGGPGYR